MKEEDIFCPLGFADSPVAVVGGNGEYMRRLRRRGIKAFAVEGSIPEEARAVIAYGGESQFDRAKALGKSAGVPVYLVCASADAVTAWDGRSMAPSFALGETVAPKSAEVACGMVSDTNLPAAFGAVCSAAVGIFDCEATCRALGHAVPRVESEEAFSLIYEALDAVKTRERGDRELPEMLCSVALRLSRFAEREETCLFVRGGPDDCARTAAMLLTRESRPVRARGELAFIFAAVLCNFYRELLRSPTSFLPPPDNNVRAEKLAEYLGIDEFTAARLAVCKIKNAELVSYRLGEYSDELASRLGDVSTLIDESKKYFRRLYPDDGFSLRGELDSADIRTVLALAPDAFSGGVSALTLMRELGLADRFL